MAFVPFLLCSKQSCELCSWPVSNKAFIFKVVEWYIIIEGSQFEFFSYIDVYKSQSLSTHHLFLTFSYIILPLEYCDIDCSLLDGFVRENLWLFQWCSIWKAIFKVPSNICGLWSWHTGHEGANREAWTRNENKVLPCLASGRDTWRWLALTFQSSRFKANIKK